MLDAPSAILTSLRVAFEIASERIASRFVAIAIRFIEVTRERRLGPSRLKIPRRFLLPDFQRGRLCRVVMYFWKPLPAGFSRQTDKVNIARNRVHLLRGTEMAVFINVPRILASRIRFLNLEVALTSINQYWFE